MGDQRVKDPKEIQMLLAVMLPITAGNQGTKNCMKFKEILKKKGDKSCQIKLELSNKQMKIHVIS